MKRAKKIENEIEEKLKRAEALLVEYLTDNMVDEYGRTGVFEDIPEIDEARSLLLDVIDNYVHTHLRLTIDVTPRNDEVLADIEEARRIPSDDDYIVLEFRNYDIEGYDLESDAIKTTANGTHYAFDIAYIENGDIKYGSSYGA